MLAFRGGADAELAESLLASAVRAAEGRGS
jgi:hypothetical protein